MTRSGNLDRGRFWIALAVLVTVALVATFVGSVRRDGGSDIGATDANDRPQQVSVEPEALQAIAEVVAAVLGTGSDGAARSDPAELPSFSGRTYVALRAGGREVASAWSAPDAVSSSLPAAVREALKDAAEHATEVDQVEICLSHDDVAVSHDDGELTDVHVGIFGLEIRHAGVVARYSPTRMLAQNWDFDDAIERFADAYGIPEANYFELDLRIFACEQVLVWLRPSLRAVAMFRGNEVVPPDAVDRASVTALRDRLGTWLTNNVHDDGRMTYEYWPSRAEESGSNNMIRQWMATVALERLAAQLDDPSIYELAARNIDYNLDRFYSDEGGLGRINYDDEVKLGAVALAALAIHAHPESDRWSEEEQALQRTIDALWHEDGSFTTFLLPEGRNDNQNFYPGEALVYWAHLYRDEANEELLHRFMRTFRYYRAWHLDEQNRNPAFVPWHTQAYAMVWEETRDPELAEFIFEMNDWLLDMQQWDDALYPDLRGRFYDPDRPQFGVPHASSTGVYMEGLAAAYTVAQQAGDDERAQAYAQALRRGLRSLMQLEFADDVDLFYVTDRDAVFGGVRTTEYDNRIRVDNVQHNLMAVLQVLDDGAEGVLDDQQQP